MNHFGKQITREIKGKKQSSHNDFYLEIEFEKCIGKLEFLAPENYFLYREFPKESEELHIQEPRIGVSEDITRELRNSVLREQFYFSSVEALRIFLSMRTFHLIVKEIRTIYINYEGHPKIINSFNTILASSQLQNQFGNILDINHNFSDAIESELRAEIGSVALKHIMSSTCLLSDVIVHL